MNLSEKLHQTALRQAEKPAYYFMDQSTSYGELDSAVTKFADELHKLGVSKGDNVALVLGNSPHFIISLYGAIRAGATVIPVNPIYTPDEIGYILNSGDVKVVVALDKLIPLFEKMDPILSNVDYYVICETEPDKGDRGELSIYQKMKSFTKMVGAGMRASKARNWIPTIRPSSSILPVQQENLKGRCSHTPISTPMQMM